MERDEDTTVYQVVVNHEEQYSIWPAYREPPLGWREVGRSGLKQECLRYIEAVWTDMRPLRLRQQMEQAAQRSAPSPQTEPSPGVQAATAPRSGDDLVQRLCRGDHPVEFRLASGPPVQALQEDIERGYVHITFTNTQGGTTLGVRLDRDRCNVTQADFAHQSGTVHLEGKLTLNYVPVWCSAHIDLHTLRGHGHLALVEA